MLGLTGGDLSGLCLALKSLGDEGRVGLAGLDKLKGLCSLDLLLYVGSCENRTLADGVAWVWGVSLAGNVALRGDLRRPCLLRDKAGDLGGTW